MTQVSFSCYSLEGKTAGHTTSATKSHEINLPKTVRSMTKGLSKLVVSFLKVSGRKEQGERNRKTFIQITHLLTHSAFFSSLEVMDGKQKLWTHQKSGVEDWH